MKYKGPLLGFHLTYFCLCSLIGGPGKNIKYSSEQTAPTGTLPTLSLDSIDFTFSSSHIKVNTNSEVTCKFQPSKKKKKKLHLLRSFKEVWKNYVSGTVYIYSPLYFYLFLTVFSYLSNLTLGNMNSLTAMGIKSHFSKSAFLCVKPLRQCLFSASLTCISSA